jgi:cephalosporin-C deacetylase-like acetyl esterase
MFKQDFPGLNSDDENTAIRAYNDFCSRHEGIMAKYIFAAGTTWTGILTQGDRVAVDYLLTRPEVDPDRIGCMGLSIGGFRSAFLFGLDARIKAGVVAGWFPSYPKQMSNYFRWHTWMVYVPRMLEFFDIPDVASLNAPRPLMIMNCRQDLLYTMESMETASKKMEAIYSKMGASGHFKTNWYDVPHSLTIEMQDDAIAWLEQWLK